MWFNKNMKCVKYSYTLLELFPFFSFGEAVVVFKGCHIYIYIYIYVNMYIYIYL